MKCIEWDNAWQSAINFKPVQFFKPFYELLKCRDNTAELSKRKILKPENDNSKVHLEETGTWPLVYHQSKSDRYQNLSGILYEIYFFLIFFFNIRILDLEMLWKLPKVKQVSLVAQKLASRLPVTVHVAFQSPNFLPLPSLGLWIHPLSSILGTTVECQGCPCASVMVLSCPQTKQS